MSTLQSGEYPRECSPHPPPPPPPPPLKTPSYVPVGGNNYQSYLLVLWLLELAWLERKKKVSCFLINTKSYTAEHIFAGTELNISQL